MGRPYTKDLRQRVVAAMRGGLSSYAAAARFDVSETSARRWSRVERETGRVSALPMGGTRPFALADERDWLLTRINEQPDIPLRQLLLELKERGIEVSYFAVWNIVDRSGLTFKKNAARQRTRQTKAGAPAPPVARTAREDRRPAPGLPR